MSNAMSVIFNTPVMSLNLQPFIWAVMLRLALRSSLPFMTPSEYGFRSFMLMLTFAIGLDADLSISPLALIRPLLSSIDNCPLAVFPLVKASILIFS